MECCGATTAAVLSAVAAWNWRSRRRQRLAEQPDAVDAILGTRTSVIRRSSNLSQKLAGRVSELERRRSTLRSMSRDSFHTCVSKDGEILNTEELDELIELDEEAKKDRAEDLDKIADLRSRFDEADIQDPRKARWLEDNDLLRYVRARPTLNEGEALLRKMLAWRCEQEKVWGVDLVDGSWGYMYAAYKKDLLDAPEWWAFLYEYMHFTIYGDDAFSIPVTYANFGQQDLQGAAREVGSDALIQFMVYFTDNFLDSVRTSYQKEATGDGGTMFKHGGVVILDVGGLSWRHKGDITEFSKPGTVSKFLHVERQRRSFVVRAPRIFTWIWKIVSPLIDARAREKMQIIGAGDSIQPLIDELGEDLVPQCIGGKMPDLPVRPTGPIPEGAFEQFKKERAQRRRARQ